MTDQSAEIDALAQRIRDEADIAARPGQYDRLNQIALDLETLILPPVGERPGHYPGCTREAGHFGPCEPNALSLPTEKG